jgi:hypothetical protein
MRTRILAFLAVALLAACKRDHSDVKVAFNTAKADSVAAEPLGPGDVRITSTDGAFILALVGDSVRMQLSDSLRRSVQHDIDTSAKSGVAGMITRSVSGIVGSAMGFVVRIPVTEIDNVRYENGRVLFDTRGKSHVSMSNSGDREGKAQFTREDGERFVAAVKARQAALGVTR